MWVDRVTRSTLHICPGRTNEHEQTRTSNTARRAERNAIVKYNTQQVRDRGAGQGGQRSTGRGGARAEEGQGTEDRGAGQGCVDEQRSRGAREQRSKGKGVSA